MTPQEAERHFSRTNHVIVGTMSISDKSTCQIQGCKKHDKYSLFLGNDTRLSTLFLNVCPKHLELGIKKTYAARAKRIKKLVAQQAEVDKQNALDTLKSLQP